MFHDFAVFGQNQGRATARVAPTDIRQDAPSVHRADRDEIRAGGGIIMVLQADLFPFRQVHSAKSPFSRRGDPCGRPFLAIIPQLRQRKQASLHIFEHLGTSIEHL